MVKELFYGRRNIRDEIEGYYKNRSAEPESSGNCNNGNHNHQSNRDTYDTFDPSVLAELPPDIREEVQRMYERKEGTARASASTACKAKWNSRPQKKQALKLKQLKQQRMMLPYTKEEVKALDLDLEYHRHRRA